MSNTTEIVCILDNSGSMYSLTDDTIGGFNSFIEEQKKVKGKALTTLILFNSNYKVVYNQRDLKDVKKLTRQTYKTGGNTALLDAVGKAFETVEESRSKLKKKDIPKKTIFLIITDGEENDSREYTKEIVKSKIDDKKKENGWKFIFLGSSPESFNDAKSIGINSADTHFYNKTSEGLANAYHTFTSCTTSFRTSKD